MSASLTKDWCQQGAVCDCVEHTGQTPGVTWAGWDTATPGADADTPPLSAFFDTVGPDGFHAFVTPPDRSGVSAVDGIRLQTLGALTTGPPAGGAADGEAGDAAGWLAPPCGADDYRLRWNAPGATGTYLGAAVQGGLPTVADIMTTGGIDGQPSAGGFVTPELIVDPKGAPVGVRSQAGDTAAGTNFRLEESVDGGATWVPVPADRFFADEPVGGFPGGPVCDLLEALWNRAAPGPVVSVDQSAAIRVDVSGNANAVPGTLLTLTEAWNQNPGWWTVAADQVTYSGPDGRVSLEASIAFSSTGQRVSPETELFVNGTIEASGRQSYIRQANNDNRGSNTVTWTGPVTAGDTFELRTNRDTVATAAPIDLAHFGITATVKVAAAEGT